MVSLYARILHCLLLVSGEQSLEDYAQNVKSWDTVKAHSREILTQFANAEVVQELREPRLAAERQAKAEEEAQKKKKGPDSGSVNVTQEPLYSRVTSYSKTHASS